MPYSFLLDVGFWGLPPDCIGRDLVEIPPIVQELISQERLSAARTRIWVSTHRIGILVEGLSETQEELVTEVRGPKASVAYDINRLPTPAAKGFASAQGVESKDLFIRDVDGEKYLFAKKAEKGRNAGEMLQRIADLVFPAFQWRFQPWGEERIFPQPPSYLCALLDDHLGKVTVDGVSATRETGVREGITFARTPLTHAMDYPKVLSEKGILPLPSDRLKLFDSELQAQGTGGSTIRKEKAILERLSFEIERPQAFVIETDPSLLQLPGPIAMALLEASPPYLPFESSKGECMAKVAGFVQKRNVSAAELASRDRELRDRIRRFTETWQEDARARLADRVNDLVMFPAASGDGTLLDEISRSLGKARSLAQIMGFQFNEELADQGLRYWFAGKSSRLAEKFPRLKGITAALLAEHQKCPADLVALLRDLGNTAPGREGLPTTSEGFCLVLGLLLERSRTGCADRRWLIDQVLGMIVGKQVSFDLEKALPLLSEDEKKDWVDGLIRKMEKEGLEGTKVEWLFRFPGLDPFALFRAAKTWREGPPKGTDLLQELAQRVKTRFPDEESRERWSGLPRPNDLGEQEKKLHEKLEDIESTASGGYPAVFQKLLDLTVEIEGLLMTLPPVLNESQPQVAEKTWLLCRLAAQLERIPFLSSRDGDVHRVRQDGEASRGLSSRDGDVHRVRQDGEASRGPGPKPS